MNVFVTGGTGFIGTSLITRLIQDGYNVRALARCDAGALRLQSLGAITVRGDLHSIQNWQSALAGCDVVVHCAAPVEFWGPWWKFEQEIVVATKALLDAAIAAGVAKFIHLSSESVLQDRAALLDIDESYPYPAQPNSFYGAAKKQAEIELLRSSGAIDIIVLRSTFVWGIKAPALHELTKKLKAGSFVWVGSGESAFEAVHLTNLVEALLLAIAKGKGKTIYFVTDDEPSTVRSFFSDYFRARSLEPPLRQVPNTLVRVLASLVETLWQAMRIRQAPPISRFEWAFVAMPRRYDISKIKAELGYRPIISRKQGFTEMRRIN